jgi:hypothetical protein
MRRPGGSTRARGFGKNLGESRKPGISLARTAVPNSTAASLRLLERHQGGHGVAGSGAAQDQLARTATAEASFANLS